MSKGGFTGKGVFGSLPYLVVEYDNGKQKQCNFKHEEDVDRLLTYVEAHFPGIPLHSVEAERKLAEKEKRLAEKYKGLVLSEDAEATVKSLEKAKKYLRTDYPCRFWNVFPSVWSGSYFPVCWRKCIAYSQK